MIKRNLKKWKIEGNENLLLFAQLIDELVFDYSIPSNRIPTLNSHFLCLDALNAINGIDKNGVPEGTLNPIVEEFISSVTKDPVYNETYNPLDYFIKIKPNSSVVVKNPKELNYIEEKNAFNTIFDVFYKDNTYYQLLKKRIVEIVKTNDMSNQSELIKLTKSIITELNNSGYNIKYIFYVMNICFWKNKKLIDSPNIIDDFFAHFDFITHKYTVVIKMKNETKLIFDKLFSSNEYEDDLSPRSKSLRERDFLNKGKNESFLIVTDNDYDPYTSVNTISDAIRLRLSIYRLYNHQLNFDLDSLKYCVYDEHDIPFVCLNKQVNPMFRIKGITMKKLDNNIQLFDDELHKHSNKFNMLATAVEYHSNSLDSLSEKNQLLDMWSIFESVLQISNKHVGDRINQVCLYLIPILKRRYVYTLFIQLSEEIKKYNKELYIDIINDAESEYEIACKVCEFVLLDEKRSFREDVLKEIIDYPLLKERIEYYSNILSTRDKVYSFVEKHAERVKWQIMRIYRNRNLIIHNGESMPYLSLLIENLHYYVDDFLDYVLLNVSSGTSIESICQKLYVEECEWIKCFKNKKELVNQADIRKLINVE